MKKEFINLFGVLCFALICIGCVGHSNARDGRFLQKAKESRGVEKDIAYVEGGDAAQMLDVYRSAKVMRNRPVLIYVHGGAWRIGDKASGEQHADFYTRRGIVFVSVNYRMLPEYTHPAYVEDVASSVKWVVDNISDYGGNPNNIMIAGHSAGAHLVALLGSTPKYLQAHGLDLSVLKSVAAVDTASYDFTLPNKEKQPLVARIVKKAFGDTEASLVDASPRQYVLKNPELDYPDYKLFVTSKRGDAVVQTNKLYDALKGAGGDVEKFIVKGASHKEMNDLISNANSVVAKEILKSLR